MLNVANVIEEGRWGGPQKRICLVAKALKDFGVETTVLLPNADSRQFQENLENDGIIYKTLPLHRLGKKIIPFLTYILFFPLEILLLRKELLAGEYDLVHASGGAWQIKAPIAAKLARIPLVWHLNDTSMPGILVWLFRRLGKLSSAFFSASRRTREYYLSFREFKNYPCYLVPAPVDTAELNPQKTLPDNTVIQYPSPIIVTLCNINPVKDLETLIEAAGLLRKTLASFSVLVVGKDPGTQKDYFAKLKNMVAEKELEDIVHFTGSRKDIPSVLKAADLYVCSSYAESSPLAVWEAMAMELPVVSTDVGDVAHYLNDGQNGIIVPVGKSQALADALKVMIKDPDVAKQMGISGRQTAIRELDTAVIAGITAQAYREITEKSSEI